MENPLLRLFALQEGDLFGVLAKAHHGKAEVGLHVLLAEAQDDQPAARDVGEVGSDDRVDQRRPDQIAGDGGKIERADRIGKLGRNRPQHHGERV